MHFMTPFTHQSYNTLLVSVPSRNGMVYMENSSEFLQLIKLDKYK